MIQMLSAEMTHMGCQHRLITCTSQKKAYVKENKTLDVFYYPKTLELASTPFSFELWKAFPEHVKWADVIHYHFPWPMADLLHCTWRIKKPTLITYHSDVVRQKYLRILYQPIMKYFLKKVNNIIATSQCYVDTSEVLKKHAEKVKIIPIGIDPEHYKVNVEKQKFWREKLPESFVLFVGVLRYYKGLEYLLQALDGTSVSLVIAGTGPLLNPLQEQAKQLRGTRVIFTERLEDEDLCAVYSLAQALVIPASHRSEAYCIALVEGLYFGLPLISTEIGTGTSFVNLKDETGLIVPARDFKALRKAVLSLLSHEDWQVNMREASRERFNTLFTSKVMAEKYKEAYCNLLSYT